MIFNPQYLIQRIIQILPIIPIMSFLAVYSCYPHIPGRIKSKIMYDIELLHFLVVLIWNIPHIFDFHDIFDKFLKRSK